MQYAVADIDTDSNNDTMINDADDPVEEGTPGRILVVGAPQTAEVDLAEEAPAAAEGVEGAPAAAPAEPEVIKKGKKEEEGAAPAAEEKKKK